MGKRNHFGNFINLICFSTGGRPGSTFCCRGYCWCHASLGCAANTSQWHGNYFDQKKKPKHPIGLLSFPLIEPLTTCRTWSRLHVRHKQKSGDHQSGSSRVTKSSITRQMSVHVILQSFEHHKPSMSSSVVPGWSQKSLKLSKLTQKLS